MCRILHTSDRILHTALPNTLGEAHRPRLVFSEPIWAALSAVAGAVPLYPDFTLLQTANLETDYPRHRLLSKQCAKVLPVPQYPL